MSPQKTINFFNLPLLNGKLSGVRDVTCAPLEFFGEAVI